MKYLNSHFNLKPLKNSLYSKKLFLLSYIILFTACSNNRVGENEITTIYLIRHAEKDISNPTNQDPLLTVEGEQRAAKWATILGDIPFDALYTTPYQRNISTVVPLSQKTGLTPVYYQPEEFLEAKNREKWKGKTILVCGHSNTIPALANAILNEERYPMLADSVYGKLYIAVIKGTQTRVHTLNLE